jgi:hypothetical protein
MEKAIHLEPTCSPKYSLNNGNNISSISDFLNKIESLRSQVRLNWQNTIKNYEGFVHPKIPINLPEYFVDRYSFRVYLHSRFGKNEDVVTVPDYDIFAAYNSWYDSLSKNFSALPTHNLPTPSLKAKIPQSDFRAFLFQEWRKYIRSLDIEVSENYGQDPVNFYWFEYFQNSCHFPKRPALSGPSYFYRLSLKQQEFLIKNYGASGVMDFFVFMQQVHEESHIQQKGEPLLSEFIHAWLWCEFLKRSNLEIFQINDETMFSCNLERARVIQLEFTKSEVKNFFKDTYIGSMLYFPNRITYENICLVAFLFDNKKMRYTKYLDIILEMFLQKDASAWQDTLNKQLLSAVEMVFKK